MHIVALTTCHNRKATTLACIEDLYSQVMPTGVTLKIVVVDDGSDDGTVDAILQRYPEVELVQGGNSLYWAGGMRFGWEMSVKNKSFDALLVFNDDIRLETTSLANLISCYKYASKQGTQLYAVSGAFTDTARESITYGGFIRRPGINPLRFDRALPSGTPKKVDAINMNFTLIHSDALKKVGFLAKYFKHNTADIEFGLRLIKAGGSLWLSPEPVGTCDRNPSIGTSMEPGISTTKRLARLMSIKEQPPLQRALYYRYHSTWYWPILWASPYIEVLFQGLYYFIKKPINPAKE